MSAAILRELISIEESLGGGTLGVYALSSSGKVIAYNEEVVFPTASVIKAAIVAEWCLQEGTFERPHDETVTLTREDVVFGSGVLARLNPGHTYTINELAYLAMSVSDNTASNAVLRAVGGVDVVNARMHGDWGMPDTTVHRPIKFHLSPDDPPHTATGTPRDMGHFMNAVANGTLLDEPAIFHLETLLGLSDDTAMIPRYLEVNAFAGDLDVAAPLLSVFHKPGAVTGVRNDAGFVRRGDASDYVAMAICTKNVPDTRWTVANAGCEAVAQVARLLTAYLLPASSA